MNKPLYQQLATRIDAFHRCAETDNAEWYEKHLDAILAMVDYLPHGSGIDGDTRIDLERSNGNKIIITSQYHAMDDNGYYDGWIDFTITVKPSLMFGIELNITGNFGRYQDIKAYLEQQGFRELLKWTRGENWNGDVLFTR